MSGIIYIITTGDESYVGSTNDFRNRINKHKSNIYNKNSENYNINLYKKIRENNGQYEINIYEDNLSLNKKELCIYEEEVRLLLGATLNSIRAYRTKEQILQQDRDSKTKHKAVRQERSAVPTKCECGCFVRRGDIARHKRTAKHIKRMISQEQNETVKHLQMSDAE